MGGIDFSVWKIYLRASYKPEHHETVYYQDINCSLKVPPAQENLVNEVKKVGVVIDRGLEL